MSLPEDVNMNSNPTGSRKILKLNEVADWNLVVKSDPRTLHDFMRQRFDANDKTNFEMDFLSILFANFARASNLTESSYMSWVSKFGLRQVKPDQNYPSYAPISQQELELNAPPSTPATPFKPPTSVDVVKNPKRQLEEDDLNAEKKSKFLEKGNKLKTAKKGQLSVEGLVGISKLTKSLINAYYSGSTTVPKITRQGMENKGSCTFKDAALVPAMFEIIISLWNKNNVSSRIADSEEDWAVGLKTKAEEWKLVEKEICASGYLTQEALEANPKFAAYVQFKMALLEEIYNDPSKILKLTIDDLKLFQNFCKSGIFTIKPRIQATKYNQYCAVGLVVFNATCFSILNNTNYDITIINSLREKLGAISDKYWNAVFAKVNTEFRLNNISTVEPTLPAADPKHTDFVNKLEKEVIEMNKKSAYAKFNISTEPSSSKST